MGVAGKAVVPAYIETRGGAHISVYLVIISLYLHGELYDVI